MEIEKLQSAVESILFASENPVTSARLREVFEEIKPSEEELENLLAQIHQKYQDSSYGFELRQSHGGYHFCTKPQNAEWVRKFLASRPFRLSRSALETLAIIAYRQPITRAEIDSVRDMDSSHLLRTLMERGIVKMAGKAEIPGRPVIYATTPKFLELVGLNSLSDLPPLTELHELEGDTEEPKESLEDSLDRVMGEPLIGEPISREDKKLEEIEDLIHSIQRPEKDIFPSPLHSDIAEENHAALAAVQATRFPRKKRTVLIEEEVAAQMPLETTIAETSGIPPQIV